MPREIMVRFVERPRQRDMGADIRWICNSLGVCGGRDDVSFKIVKNILNRYPKEHHLSTEMIAKDLLINPNRVNHHIRNMMDSGLFYRERKKIVLRGGSFTRALEEMKKDSERMFDDLIEKAKKIDERLGL